ncbi:hypothetical protein SEUCBS139899_001714 [Sporothrix eucalyptigena]
MTFTTHAQTLKPLAPRSIENTDINPDPTRYQIQPEPTFNSDTSEILGLNESWWEPIPIEKASKDVRAQQRSSSTFWWERRLGVAWIMASLLAWCFGLTFLAELAKEAGLKDISAAHFRIACTKFLDQLVVEVPVKLRGQLQAIRGVVGVSSV